MTPCRVAVLIVCTALCIPGAGAQPIADLAGQVVENFRRTIVLQEAAGQRQGHGVAGRYLFHRNREIAEQLVDRLARGPREVNDRELVAFLDLLNARKDWRDVDRLALAGVLNEALYRLPAGHALEPRTRSAAAELSRIRQTYNHELTATLSSAQAPPRRGAWANYLKFLQERHSAARVLEELRPFLLDPVQLATPSQRGTAVAEKARQDEWTDADLPSKTLLLTFDDGPHPRHTIDILRTLERFRVRAIFFQVGENIGQIRGDHAEPSRNPEVMAEILKGGHVIGNHTHTHPLLLKLDGLRVAEEIDRTERLLAAALPGDRGRAPLFRPPYGARNPLVLAEVAERGLRSVLWNIDSRDWADPIPQSIAVRVIREVEREGRGIILFHDIHARTANALPVILEELIKRGYRFARYESGRLVTDDAAH